VNEIKDKYREYLSTRDVAELTLTTDSTVRYWRHIGYGPQGFVVGRRVLYKADEVHAWLESLYAAASGPASGPAA
jgi:excisionase family DNA binding protein